MYCPRYETPITISKPININLNKAASTLQYSLNNANFGPISNSPPDDWSNRLIHRLKKY